MTPSVAVEPFELFTPVPARAEPPASLSDYQDQVLGPLERLAAEAHYLGFRNAGAVLLNVASLLRATGPGKL